jgi:VWFA-related protein
MPSFSHFLRGIHLRGAGAAALLLCGLMVTILTGFPLWGQQPAGQPQAAGQQKPQIAVEVKVVNVLATVRNQRGDVVFALGKDDFVLEEDGHEQSITFFSRESDLPLTLGMLVDTSLSQRSVLAEERKASYGFLDHLLLEDKDKAFLIHFDREVELLQDLTASRDKLEHAISLLTSPDWGSGGTARSGGGGDGRHGGYGHGRGGGTQLYDAVYLASTELMKKQAGRKALVVLSDGVDRGSKETLAGAIESAQRADTLVYSIFFQGEQPYGGNRGYGGMHGGMGGGRRYPQEERPDGKKVLKQISTETGARLFEVTKKQPIDAIYAQIEQELRSQYSLGYAPAGPDAAPGYHRLTLKTRQKDMSVQARTGFYIEP